MQKQEIIRKDKNGAVLNAGDWVQSKNGGTGVVATCPFGSTCSFDDADKVWIKWETATRYSEEDIGRTLWSESKTVTLLKRKAQPHVHAELIKAWADDPAGVVIQHLNKLCEEWLDVLNNTPLWDTKAQYRIKPKTQKVKKYNFSYKNKFGDIQTTLQMFTEEVFQKRFVDTGACLEFTCLDWTMKEVEVEV